MHFFDLPEHGELGILKADFFKTNAALVKAIEDTTEDNCRLLDNKALLSSLRAQSVESYKRLVQYVNYN